MKHVFRTIAVAAFVALPTMASAQADKPLSFGLSAGLSMPMGDLGDAVDAGYVLAGHVWLKPASLKSLILRGDVAYDGFKYKVGDANFRDIAVVANAIFHPSAPKSSVAPYILGGVGMFNGKASAGSSTYSVSASSTDLGIQAGGGIEFKLSGFSTFAEAKFVNVFGDGSSSSWIPITFGVRF